MLVEDVKREVDCLEAVALSSGARQPAHVVAAATGLRPKESSKERSKEVQRRVKRRGRQRSSAGVYTDRHCG